jgi:hypothetical protein
MKSSYVGAPMKVKLLSLSYWVQPVLVTLSDRPPSGIAQMSTLKVPLRVPSVPNVTE